MLIVQLLNYEKILREKKNLLGKRDAGGRTFERRYDYRGETVTFTLSRGEASESVTLRPLTRSMLEAACVAAGFTEISAFGDLAMGIFDLAGSTDLVLTARRPGRPS
jgi:hypothetical protein